MTENFVGSRYNIPVPLKDGRRLVYNSLTQAFSVWERHDVEAFDALVAGEDVAPERLTDLVKNGFVQAESLDEVKLLEEEYQRARYNPAHMTLTIAPTMACNFACDYCFQGQDKPHATMSKEVQDAVVGLVERAQPHVKSVGITWYGGEPLTRLKVIEALSDRVIAACSAKGISYNGSIVTNGYLLTADAARSLYARGVTWIQVTLDGTPEYHDTRRYLLGGKGSFERIIENLKSFIDVLPKLAVSIRVNIDDRNAKDIHTLLDFLSAQGLAKKKNLNVYFAPVEATTEGCHLVEDVTMAKSRYGQLEADLYMHAYTLGLTPLPWPPRFHGNCGAVRPTSLVILPTGELHKCWDTVSWPDKAVGTIFNIPALATNELMKKWVAWTPFENATCKNCKILPNCAGSCAYKFIHAEDTRGEAATLPCPSWKYNIKERLIQRAIGKGAITADDYERSEVTTIPSELCADKVLDGGKALPENIAKYYEEQKRIKRLPVVATGT